MGSLFNTLDHVNRSRDPALEERRARRDLVDLVSHATARGQTHDVRVINVSPLGLMCRTEATLLPGEKLTIWLPILKDIPAEIRWAENGRVGMEFLSPITPTLYDAMLALIPPRQTEW
jgi:hypothetical protein